MVAAGKGTRTGLSYNKVFYKIGNVPIITQTLKPFEEDEDCERIVMSISPQEQEDFESVIDSEKVVYVHGGATRQESGYLGLQLSLIHIYSGYGKHRRVIKVITKHHRLFPSDIQQF